MTTGIWNPQLAIEEIGPGVSVRKIIVGESSRGVFLLEVAVGGGCADSGRRWGRVECRGPHRRHATASWTCL